MQEKDNWISVNDALPPSDADVLAYVQYDDFPITAYYKAGFWNAGYQAREYFDSPDGCIENVLRQYTVTHWQPLPSPPKQ